MSDVTPVVLEKALEAAEKYQAPLLLASTSGLTAEKMLTLAAHRAVRLIVINHEVPYAPADWRFDFEIRKKIKEAGHKVVPVKAGLIPPAASDCLAELRSDSIISITPAPHSPWPIPSKEKSSKRPLSI